MQIVLCIDDDVMSLALRKLLLETQGYTVLAATGGLAGLEIARRSNLDVVVLDFQMPIMNGEQVARILKHERPSLPIILLTGHVESDIPGALLSTVDSYLQKGSGDLLASLQSVLNCKKLKRPPGLASKQIPGRRIATNKLLAGIQ